MELRVEQTFAMGGIRRITHFTPLMFIRRDRTPSIMYYGKGIGWSLSAESSSIGGGEFVSNELFMLKGVAIGILPLSANTHTRASLKLRDVNVYRYRTLFQMRSLKI